MALYPGVARELLERCDEYRKRILALWEFKTSVWGAAQTIVAAEERALHEFLKKPRGGLEIVEYTTGNAQVFDKTIPIVAERENQLEAYLNEP
ncbi:MULTISPECIES: hypothetical protein [Amycolatopsis]|nr:hypothetical protein [Amycolatopsis tucumanensis]MCF6423689.1 hypothetical protein [Amycolatopsis tucumanensis]